MVSDRELIDIVIRLLNGHGDKQDIEQLHNWKQTSFDRNVNQQAKYIINIGEAEGIKIGDSLNTELLEEIRDLLRSQSVTSDLDIDWQKMSQVMLEEYQRLTTNPLTAGEGVFHSSDRVYVRLGLVERKRKARHKEDVSPEKGSELYQETEITQRFKNKEFLEQVLKLGQSPKSQGKRIAIIGEPGAGKTTLLQHIAKWVTEQIEEAIVIWISLADLRGQELEFYLLEKWLQAVARRLGQAEVTPQVKDAFVTQFQQGRVWLLLDGVDEMQVSSVNPLSEISQQVRMGGLLSQAKIVLTCRVNLWDSNYNALDTFDTYRTLEFSYPQQVEQFIDNWFSSLSPEEQQTGQNLCTALKEQGKERIRDLVKNPLRLTLLCFNWYLGNGKLPDTKAGLYEQFVDDFYEWKREQFTTTGKQRRQLNEALGELAREAIDNEETRFRLKQEFVCEYLGKPDDEDSLFSLVLRLGWLNKVGVDGDNPRKGVYAFFHPSFQEYFAALVIDDWHYFLNHIPENPSHPDASYRIFESQWKEVFLLWLGRKDIAKEQKDTFIRTLKEFEDKCGDFYTYRAYFLAVEGFAEFRDCTLASEMMRQIMRWGLGNFRDDLLEFQIFPDIIFQKLPVSIREEAKALLTKIERQQVIEALIEILDNSYSNVTSFEVVKTLGEIALGNEQAIMALVNFLKNTEDKFNRDRAIASLGKIAVGNQIAIQVLKEILHKTPDDNWYTLYLIDEAIENISSLDRQQVRQRNQNSVVDKNTRGYTKLVNNLENSNSDSIKEQLTEYLIEILNTPKCIRQTVAMSLEKNDTYSELKGLASLLKSPDDACQADVDSLKRGVVESEQLMIALLSLLETSESTREGISGKLRQVDRNTKDRNHKITLILLETLVEVPVHRWGVDTGINKFAQGNKQSIKSLIKIMLSTENRFTRFHIASILEKNIPKSLLELTIVSCRKYINEQHQMVDFERFNPYYSIIWNCTKNVIYPKFYQWWHSQMSSSS